MEEKRKRGRPKRVYPEHNKEYLQEEKKLSTLCKDWLRADSKLGQIQATEALNVIKRKQAGRWVKNVLICEKPKTWKVVSCEKGEKGAYRI